MTQMAWLDDGPGWSPDGGKFWVRDGKAYWHDGEITDLSTGLFRTMPMAHNEDYSQLSDAERATRRDAAKAEREAYEAECRKREAKRMALRQSARAKLTDDEAEACELYDLDEDEDARC